MLANIKRTKHRNLDCDVPSAEVRHRPGDHISTYGTVLLREWEQPERCKLFPEVWVLKDSLDLGSALGPVLEVLFKILQQNRYWGGAGVCWVFRRGRGLTQSGGYYTLTQSFCSVVWCHVSHCCQLIHLDLLCQPPPGMQPPRPDKSHVHAEP